MEQNLFDQYLEISQRRDTIIELIDTQEMTPDIGNAYERAAEKASRKLNELELRPELAESAVEVGRTALISLQQIRTLRELGGINTENEAELAGPHCTRLQSVARFLTERQVLAGEPQVRNIIGAAAQFGLPTAVAEVNTIKPLLPTPNNMRAKAITSPSVPEAEETVSVLDRYFDMRAAATIAAFMGISEGDLLRLGKPCLDGDLITRLTEKIEPVTADKGVSLRNEARERETVLANLIALVGNSANLAAVVSEIDGKDPRAQLLAYLLENFGTDSDMKALEDMVAQNRSTLITYDLPKRGGAQVVGIATLRDGEVIGQLHMVTSSEAHLDDGPIEVIQEDVMPRTGDEKTDKALKVVRGKFGKIISWCIASERDLESMTVSSVIEAILPMDFKSQKVGLEAQRKRNITIFTNQIKKALPKADIHNLTLEQILYVHGLHDSAIANLLANDDKKVAETLYETAAWCIRQSTNNQASVESPKS